METKPRVVHRWSERHRLPAPTQRIEFVITEYRLVGTSDGFVLERQWIDAMGGLRWEAVHEHRAVHALAAELARRVESRP
jgi:hypothetical protein